MVSRWAQERSLQGRVRPGVRVRVHDRTKWDTLSCWNIVVRVEHPVVGRTRAQVAHVCIVMLALLGAACFLASVLHWAPLELFVGLGLNVAVSCRNNSSQLWGWLRSAGACVISLALLLFSRTNTRHVVLEFRVVRIEGRRRVFSTAARGSNLVKKEDGVGW